MKISEVMELTGLTKKAINYYEDEELIKPDVNLQNNYREYSQSDIDRLVQISVLRQLDVSIKDIKDILSKPEMLKDKLEQHLTRLDDKVKRLEKSKSVIKSCLGSFSDSADGLPQLTKQLSTLNKFLEMDERYREGFMKRQLQRIFPENFGKMLVMHFSPFLNEPVDTPVKEEAWLNVVKFLDEVETIEYPEEMQEMYKKLTDEDMEKFEKFSCEDEKKWINITEEELVLERKRIFESVRNFNSNTDLQFEGQKISRISKSLKEQMKNVGYYDKFTESLKVLSKDYDKYIKRREDFFKTINLKFDEEGRIIESE